ncbi:MAG: thermonuclease family protein, partial [Deltaproteobacteria bacterium]|nr:thermonuclease family protein [Deltaproteobacteria bacterium]
VAGLAVAAVACDGGGCPETPVEPVADGAPAFCYVENAGCPGGGERGEVQAVYDGDTLTLSDGTKVRLLGINAPEQPDASGGDGLGDPVTCFGPEAGRFLRSWVQGREVCLRDAPGAGARSDQYGRRLRYVFVDGVNVNLLLVATGHACVYDAFEEAACQTELVTQEARAAQLGLGLWGVCGDLHGDPCARND